MCKAREQSLLSASGTAASFTPPPFLLQRIPFHGGCPCQHPAIKPHRRLDGHAGVRK